MTDIVLSQFISSTGVEPAVAQDILDSHEWDLQAALRSYSHLKTAKSVGTSTMSTDISCAAARSYDTAPPITTLAVARNAVGKPFLQKADAVEVADETAGRKWSRGISRASENLALVTRARSEVAKGFTLDDPNCVPNHTFTLPDLTAIQPEDFRAFVENDLIETATLVSLEQAGRLNWWADNKPCQRLLPLATTGDGNCLLHAASLGIWGFHDRLLTLRKSLNHVLSKSEYESSIYRRWRWHQTILNKQSGLIYTEAEWDKEWFNILKLSSAEPRLKPNTYICCDNSPSRGGLTVVEETDDTNDNTQYESLEEVHVFALAYAIKRPIIVIADVYLRDSAGEPLAPIPFGGIYLPLGCDPKNCLRSPLVLTYDAAHFSALVSMKKDTAPEESELPAIIPITDSHGDLLPVMFLVDPGESFQWGHEDADPQVVQKLSSASEEERLHVVQTYLDLVHINVTTKAKDSLPGGGAANGLDDGRSMADSNESESSSGGKSDKDKQKNGLSKHMKNVRQKLKRSISKLTRRTSDENDGGGKASTPGTGPILEKNMIMAQNGAKSPLMAEAPVQLQDVNVKLNGSTSLQVGENARYRWQVDMVKDIQGASFLRNPNVVLGSPMSLDNETSYHEEMIHNYLAAARLRFISHQKEKERRDNLNLQNGMTRCANQGCELFGSAGKNYLCANCFNKQKLQLEEMKAQRETTTIGKSTFYANSTLLDDVENDPAAKVLNNQRPGSSRGGALPVTLPKPNQVESGKSKTPDRSLDDSSTGEFLVKPCTTPDCVFFGHEKSDYLCSQCYKRKKSCFSYPDVTNR